MTEDIQKITMGNLNGNRQNLRYITYIVLLYSKNNKYIIFAPQHCFKRAQLSFSSLKQILTKKYVNAASLEDQSSGSLCT